MIVALFQQIFNHLDSFCNDPIGDLFFPGMMSCLIGLFPGMIAAGLMTGFK